MYKQMNTIIPELEAEHIFVKHHKIQTGEYIRAGLDSNRFLFEGIERGDIYTVLINKDKKQVIMSDSPMEKRSNERFVKKAKGDVLIAGLGIGMILLAIQDKPGVKTITIVEKDQTIIDKILPHIPINSKVKVIQGDIFKYKTKAYFNTIYFDIWNNISSRNIVQMYALLKMFKKNLLPEGFIDCWSLKYLLSNEYKKWD